MIRRISIAAALFWSMAGAGLEAQLPTKTENLQFLPKDITIEQVLAETIKKDGIPAAVQRYKELRERTMPAGRFDFGEWSINELARKLVAAGDTAAAMAMYEMNQEYYPRSPSIDVFLAELHRARADTVKAIDRYRKSLEKDPNNQQAKARLEQLTKK